MKTTLDLPDALVKQVKLRAVRDGRKLKDTVTDLLRKGLAEEAAGPPVVRDKHTGLPLIQCKHAAPPSEELTSDRITEILLNQDVKWHRASGRYKL